MRWMEWLKERWKVESAFQVVVILIVFACTGFTVLLIKKPLFALWFPNGNVPILVSVAYWIFIFPVYNMFLLGYGFVFGQFKFFWAFEKRFFARLFAQRKK